MHNDPANFNLFGREWTVYLTVRDNSRNPDECCAYCGKPYAINQLIEINSIEGPEAETPYGIELLIRNYLRQMFPDRAICRVGSRCDTKGYQREIRDILKALRKPTAVCPHQQEFIWNELLAHVCDRGDIDRKDLQDWSATPKFWDLLPDEKYLQKEWKP